MVPAEGKTLQIVVPEAKCSEHGTHELKAFIIHTVSFKNQFGIILTKKKEIKYTFEEVKQIRNFVQ